ncbi:MAG: hypothetical protein IT247_05270 [Bacteroidia bacterium]|nr:hypothetical protein [Bacteroidia bacterium]
MPAELAATTITTLVVREHKIVEVDVVNGNNHGANINRNKNKMQGKNERVRLYFLKYRV